MYIIGQNNNVLVYKNLRIWAENGFIRIEDSRDNSFTTISVRDFLPRVAALNDMIKNSRSTDETFYSDEIKEYQTLVENAIIIMRQAQEQGMPDDKTALRDRKIRRKKQIRMPIGLSEFI